MEKGRGRPEVMAEGQNVVVQPPNDASVKPSYSYISDCSPKTQPPISK